MNKKKKLKKWVIPAFIILLLLIPTTYSFYSSRYDSSIISKFFFKSEKKDSYVRAIVVTYWVDTRHCSNDIDLTTCSISGKSSWNLKSGIVNSDWILLEDGHYYYRWNVNSEEITDDNINTSDIALIDSTLSFADLSDELLAGNEVVPQYEIIYEFIESSSVENAWKVSYDTNYPVLIQ